MQLKPITIRIEEYPDCLRPYLCDAKVFDSSCSPNAKVIYIDKGCGYFLKTAKSGSLETEYKMTRFFHSKGLSASVPEYICGEKQDYLLTEKVQGEDCTASEYLEDPERLCDIYAEILRSLHSLSHAGCPVSNHTERYKAVIDKNFASGCFDLSFASDNHNFTLPEQAYQYINEHFHLLQNDTLLHGDYCLPNVILNDWKFSGVVDVGNGGVGDRHVDLFWGAWTLRYNLGTDKYRNRFFDAYGRNQIDEEKLRLIEACEIFG